MKYAGVQCYDGCTSFPPSCIEKVLIGIGSCSFLRKKDQVGLKSVVYHIENQTFFTEQDRIPVTT